MPDGTTRMRRGSGTQGQGVGDYEVVNASVMPSMVSANTNAATLMLKKLQT